MQEGPLQNNTDSTIVDISHVASQVSNHQCVTQYMIEGSDLDVKAQPFMHQVILKGEEGVPINVKELFDDGAMVNSICNTVYPKLQETIGPLIPSPKILQMADGSHVPSDGRWIGNVTLGGHTVKGAFEIFPSGGGWSLLFGKPLLKQYQAIHDYKNDTINIPVNGNWVTIANECDIAQIAKKKQANSLMGDDKFPSRQVASSLLKTAECIDEQTALESFIKAQYPNSGTYNQKARRMGHRGCNKPKERTGVAETRIREGAVNVVQDTGVEPVDENGLQPEIEIGGDQSLFTRTTDPHNP